jgi:hypothetical protein
MCCQHNSICARANFSLAIIGKYRRTGHAAVSRTRTHRQQLGQLASHALLLPATHMPHQRLAAVLLVLLAATAASDSAAATAPVVPPPQPPQRRQVRWMVDAGQAKQGVQPWATHVASQGAITGLVGCCGRFHIDPNGTWFDEWPESKYPLSNWNFTHSLGLTMHFVFTIDQPALINQTALLAIPKAVAAAVASNFTGYALDYETAPAGGWGSAAFQAETDGLLVFVTVFLPGFLLVVN